MKHDIIDFEGKKVSDIELNDSIFAQELRLDILHQMVRWQRAKARSGNHSTITISDIRGGGAKPYSQKGTGRARQGSIRSTQFRGGSTTFGPKPRDYSFKLNKKFRQKALAVSLSQKVSDKKFIIVDSYPDIQKTKEVKSQLSNIASGKVLLVGDRDTNESFFKSSKNIKHVSILDKSGVNVYDILKSDFVIIDKNSLNEVEGRFK